MRVGLVLPHYPLKPDAATETKWRGRKFTREKPLLFPRKSPWKPKTCVAFTFDFVTKGCKNLQGRFSLAIFSLNLDHWRCIIIFRFEKFFSLSNVKFRKHCIIQCRKRKVHQIPSRIVVRVALNKAQMLWWARRKKQKMHWMIGTIEKVFFCDLFFTTAEAATNSNNAQSKWKHFFLPTRKVLLAASQFQDHIFCLLF